MSRQWVNDAVRSIELDFQLTADTHLVPLPIPGAPDCPIFP